MYKAALAVVFSFLFLINSSVFTQESDDTCSSIVTEALEVTEQSCNDLDRNQACYGNNRVDVVFWEEQEEGVFNNPSDRIGLLDLQSIATSPLNIDPEAWGVAVLNLQTNLPGGLPGQAVTFMLMGDTTVESGVSPDDVVEAIEPIPAIVNANANIRSQPSTNANIVTTAASGDEVMLVGMNDVGDWYEIVLDEGTAWIWGELVGGGDTSSLPVTYGGDVEPNYAPMQAFYFQSGIGDLQCNEAPNALIVQNPSGDAVQLRVNDLNVTIGSTLIMTMDEIDGESVLVLSLIEGYVEVTYEGLSATLDAAGETVAISLNADNRVDENSEIIELDDISTTPIESACANAVQTTLLSGVTITDCVSPTTIVEAEQTTTTTNALVDVSDTDACVVASDSTVNFRGGPGTNYNTVGQLTANTLATVTGKADGTDGYLWWQTEGEKWVRSDLVSTGGACDSVVTVEAPEPPVTQTTTSETNDISYQGPFFCSGTTINAVANQPILLKRSHGVWTSIDDASYMMSISSAWATVDGATVTFFSQIGPEYDEINGGYGFSWLFTVSGLPVGTYSGMSGYSVPAGPADVQGSTKPYSTVDSCTIIVN